MYVEYLGTSTWATAISKYDFYHNSHFKCSFLGGMVWKSKQMSASFINQILLICMKMSWEATSERNEHTLVSFLKTDCLDENMNKSS